MTVDHHLQRPDQGGGRAGNDNGSRPHSAHSASSNRSRRKSSLTELHSNDDKKTGDSELSLGVKEIFRMSEKGRDGPLNWTEMARVLKKLSPSLTTDETKVICGEADVEKSGTISCAQFVRWIGSGSLLAKQITTSIFKNTGDARNAKIKATFDKYDREGDGQLNMDELNKVFRAMGSFTNDEIRHVFADLDKSGDGNVSYDEFESWIKEKSPTKEIAKAKAILAPSDDDGLEACYYNFCGAGRSDMDNKSFLKMCIDCNIVDKKFPFADVDLIYNSTKLKPKGERTISYEQFEVACLLVAERKGVKVEEIRAAIRETGRPVVLGTKADNVRFFDEGKHMRTERAPSKADQAHELKRKLKRSIYRPAPKVDPSYVADNSELWKLFGPETPAGRSLRLLYNSPKPARVVSPVKESRLGFREHTLDFHQTTGVRGKWGGYIAEQPASSMLHSVSLPSILAPATFFASQIDQPRLRLNALV